MKIPAKTPSELHHVKRLDNRVGSIIGTNQLFSVRMRNFSPVDLIAHVLFEIFSYLFTVSPVSTTI